MAWFGMSRNPIDQSLVECAQKLAKTAPTTDILRQCQAILLPALCGATLQQTANTLGISRSSVIRHRSNFRETNGTPLFPQNWGGRRRFLMTPEEEEKFLEPWLKQAAAGAMVVVSPIRAALAQKLGRPVKSSIVYRLLARNGWRKVAPDTRHPKKNSDEQEAWKKNSQKCWWAC